MKWLDGTLASAIRSYECWPLPNDREDMRWELSDKQLDSKDINDGKLKAFGEQQHPLAESIGQNGDLTYDHRHLQQEWTHHHECEPGRN